MYRSSQSASGIEIEIEDSARDAVFTEALVALADALGDEGGGEPATHHVALDAGALPGLLDAWVGELVRLAEEEGFVPERVVSLGLEQSSLRAVVAGERSLPAGTIESVRCERVEIEHRSRDGTWHALIVLARE